MGAHGRAEHIEAPLGFVQFAVTLAEGTKPHVLAVARGVWEKNDLFVRWPATQGECLLECARRREYESADRVRIAAAIAQLGHVARGQFLRSSNGPAVLAFLRAGGDRPRLEGSNGRWSVHHVYDGRFPAPTRQRTTHAAREPRYFTDPRGLVAVHPVADALAHEVAWFSWQLRVAAWRRFDFDPDEIFREWVAEAEPTMTLRGEDR